MGVDISSLIEGRELEMVELSGKYISMDAYNIMFQFISIIRDRMTGEPLRDSKGNITSHLSGLMYRNTRFIEAGIRPIYVFDGKPPDFKRATIEKRTEQREEAKKKWEEAVRKGEPAITYAQAAARITKEMSDSAKNLLTIMGVPWIQAPSEGEMQCAYMCQKGDVWASGSQDYDSLMVGSPRLVRNLSITGRRKVPKKEVYIQVKPELIDFDLTLDRLQLTHDQFIIMGILIGTDYSEGVKGVGPKTALRIVKENKTLPKVLEKVEWPSEGPSAEEILDFFQNPPVTDEYGMELREPDSEALIKMMVDEHSFSEDRVNKVVERLEAAHERGHQSSLSGFLRK